MTAEELAAPLVRTSEGLRLKAYPCPAGVWTIGYGHTISVVRGGVITKPQAEAFLAYDLASASRAVARNVRVPLTVHQRAALIDFVFNLGETNFVSSTLLKVLNAGKHARVPAELRRWNRGRVNGVAVALPGLTTRRAAEVGLWNFK